MGRTHTTNAFSATRGFIDQGLVEALGERENKPKKQTKASVAHKKMIERHGIDDKVLVCLRNMGGVATVKGLVFEMEMDKEFVHKSLARLNRGNWIFLDTVDGILVAATPDNADLKDYIYFEEK